MKQEIKKGFNEWYKGIDARKQGLVLSNDIDSIMSCAILYKLFNIEIVGFYTFNQLYVKPNNIKELIYVDADVSEGLCFGNHPTYIKNPNCISMNRNITTSNYTQKFCGSTLLTIMSLYDYDFSQFDDEQLKVLLAIDVSFKPFYTRFKYTGSNHFKNMELDSLVNFMQSFKSDDFYETIIAYNLHEDLFLNVTNKRYSTNIKLRALRKLFPDIFTNSFVKMFVKSAKEIEIKQSFDTSYQETYSITKDQKATIFSSALVSKTNICYSAIK